MVPGYIEAEDDPLQMVIQGDKRQSQSAEITALEKQSRVDGSKAADSPEFDFQEATNVV